MRKYISTICHTAQHDLLPVIRSLTWVDWSMIFFFASRFTTFLFSTIFGTKGIFIAMGIQILLFGLGLVELRKKQALRGLIQFIVLFLGVTLLILISMSINPEAKQWMLDFSYGIITQLFDVRKGIFAAFVILTVRKPERILLNLQMSAWLSFIYLFIQMVLFIATGSWDHYYVLDDARSMALNYNLSFGYEMIFVSLVFLSSVRGRYRLVYLMFGLISAVSAFLLGSRGIMIPFLFFCLLMLFLRTQRKWQIRIGAALAVIFLVSISAVFFMRNMSTEGSSTITGIRNIDMFLNGEFASSNGRSAIWKISLDAIKEKFPLGYGVFGDRPFVGQRFRWGYSHNVFLELLASFGIIGAALFFWLVYRIVRCLMQEQFRSWQTILILLAALNGKLLISDSFWYYEFFWALVSVLLIIRSDLKVEQASPSVSARKMLRAPAVVTALIFVNVLLLALFLGNEIRSQRYKPVSFKRPTVVIGIKDSGRKTNKIILDELNRRNIKASFFTEPGVSAKKPLKELMESGLADINIQLNGQEHTMTASPSLEEYLSDGKQRLADAGATAPVSAVSLLSEIHPANLQLMREQTSALLIQAKRKDDYYYRTVAEDDIYKLDTLDSNLDKDNYRARIPFIRQQIALAHDRDGLIILYFNGFSDSTTSDFSLDRFGYFTVVLDYLEKNEFDFITISDLTQAATMNSKEKTLRNYILNLEIFRKLGIRNG